MEEKERENKLKSFTFYDLYGAVIGDMEDEQAGAFIEKICCFMFDEPINVTEESEWDEYCWNGIVDMLSEVKEMEKENKNLKKYNQDYKHFRFYYNFYEGIKLMERIQKGVYIKGICSYVFNNVQPKFSDKKLQICFNISKRNIDLCKTKSVNGSKGGRPQKENVVKKTIVKEEKKEINYEEFRKKNSNIKGELFGRAKEQINLIDWTKFEERYNVDNELKREEDIFRLVNLYKQKYRD